MLMNNAGGTFAPSRTTHDGHEPNFQVNHLAPFLLTNLLRPQLAAAGSSLVVNTSSIGNLMGKIVLDDLDYEHRRAIEFPAYGTGKLMNIVFTRGIAQRWSDDGVVSVAVHPGPVGSSFGRDSWFVGLLYRSPLKRFATISVPDGAAPLIALAERGPDPEINGRYFSRFNADGRENKQAQRPVGHRRPVGAVGGTGRADLSLRRSAWLGSHELVEEVILPGSVDPVRRLRHADAGEPGRLEDALGGMVREQRGRREPMQVQRTEGLAHDQSSASRATPRLLCSSETQ